MSAWVAWNRRKKLRNIENRNILIVLSARVAWNRQKPSRNRKKCKYNKF